jgi:hypothetical protein
MDDTLEARLERLQKIDQKKLKEINSDFLNGKTSTGLDYSHKNYITDLKPYLSSCKISINRVLKKVYGAIEIKRKESPEVAFVVEEAFKDELEKYDLREFF